MNQSTAHHATDEIFRIYSIYSAVTFDTVRRMTGGRLGGKSAIPVIAVKFLQNSLREINH